MELKNYALLLLSISSLILSISAEATDLSPASAPVSYISSAPDASPAASPSPLSGDSDVALVLGSTIKTGAQDAELTLEFLSKRAKDPSTSVIEADCLEQCQDNYAAITDDFKKAQDALSSDDFYLVSENLSAVFGDIDACQLCFSEMLGTDESPFANFEESIKKAAEESLTLLQYTS